MTVAQWVKHCIAAAAVEPLDFYLPESHWYPTEYRGCWRWMGDNQGHTDDGAMLALHYRTRNEIQATEVLLMNSSAYISSENASYCRQHLDRAWQHNLLAQATDVLGLAPRNSEREYGLNHSRDAVAELNIVLGVLKQYNPWFLARDRIQVDVESGKVLLGNVTGLGFENVSVTSAGHALADLPVAVSITQSGTTHNFTVAVSRREYRGVQYWQLDVNFTGSLSWESGVGKYFIDIAWNASSIDYSPSMLEHSTVHLEFGDYATTNDLFLPLANGLIAGDGMALVKNCSAHHTAVHWRENSIGFEEASLHHYSNYQLFFLDAGTSVADALAFANRVNTSPVVWLEGVLSWP
jgi:hypothetical protein